MVNPLEKLLVDSHELDSEMLASTLEPYVRIDSRSHEIRGTALWDSLSAVQRTIAYLLSRKGLVGLELISSEDEAASPSVIERGAGVAGNTLRPILSRLNKQRVIERRDRGYAVPGHSVERAKTYLADGKEVPNGSR